ncbi:hypothetical protein [Massilia sp. TS11]|uniref:hypothetical protein n=1 Tax=Massilia sp. TS11 TaxID=2908003 RepID=UPI001EDA5503|nr:hypothetical protein [Massilia sp. TS11]MCG2586590.1 hypothetical protein [Massilia sp. TS11]
MRSAFEAWAAKDGHIVRRREDKPDEYLVYETQRRWMIWQAALAHSKPTTTRKKSMAPDEAEVRNRVLNEVLAAFSGLEQADGIDGIVKVINSLKSKQAEQA